jgi:hypothetical protein
LTLVVATMVWFIVQGIINNQTEKAKDCFNGLGKLTLNSQYTCFDSNSDPKKFKFLIERGDIDLDQILVGISSDGNSEEIYINSTNTNYLLMDKDSARSYNSTSFTTRPVVISIFPIVNGRQCEQADSIKEIKEC